MQTPPLSSAFLKIRQGHPGNFLLPLGKYTSRGHYSNLRNLNQLLALKIKDRYHSHMECKGNAQRICRTGDHDLNVPSYMCKPCFTPSCLVQVQLAVKQCLECPHRLENYSTLLCTGAPPPPGVHLGGRLWGDSWQKMEPSTH